MPIRAQTFQIMMFINGVGPGFTVSQEIFEVLHGWIIETGKSTFVSELESSVGYTVYSTSSTPMKREKQIYHELGSTIEVHMDLSVLLAS